MLVSVTTNQDKLSEERFILAHSFWEFIGHHGRTVLMAMGTGSNSSSES